MQSAIAATTAVAVETLSNTQQSSRTSTHHSLQRSFCVDKGCYARERIGRDRKYYVDVVRCVEVGRLPMR